MANGPLPPPSQLANVAGADQFGPPAPGAGLSGGPPVPGQVPPAPVGAAAPEAAGPGGLENFANRLGKASISFLTQTPQIELDRMAAGNALIEQQANAAAGEAQAAKVKAQEDLQLQNLSRMAFSGGPNADAALAEIFAIDPTRADKIFDGLGVVGQAGREEAARDANAILALPPNQRRPAILERAARIEAQGRDASQTLSLLGMDAETQNNQLRTIEAAAQTGQERAQSQQAARTATTGERQASVAERGLELREDELELARQGKGGEQVQQNLKTEEGLRKEVNTLLKDYFQVADATARVRAAGTDPSGAGDLALIFNFMKILDPGSTVREGEFANAQNSGGVDDKVRGLYNTIVNGKRLSADQRTDFLTQANSLFDAQTGEATNVADAFERIARNAGVNVDNVLATFQERSGTAPSAFVVEEVQ